MALRTWDPFREIDALRRELERAVEDNGGWRRPFSRTSFLPAQGARSYPLMNIGEDTDSVYVEALAPGLDPDSLKIAIHQGQLRIEGQKPGITPEVKAEAYHRKERGAGGFVRSLSLPADVDADSVKAQYKNGLLYITMPKTEQAKPRQIRVEFN